MKVLDLVSKVEKYIQPLSKLHDNKVTPRGSTGHKATENGLVLYS